MSAEQEIQGFYSHIRQMAEQYADAYPTSRHAPIMRLLVNDSAHNAVYTDTLSLDIVNSLLYAPPRLGETNGNASVVTQEQISAFFDVTQPLYMQLAAGELHHLFHGGGNFLWQFTQLLDRARDHLESLPFLETKDNPIPALWQAMVDHSNFLSHAIGGLLKLAHGVVLEPGDAGLEALRDLPVQLPDALAKLRAIDGLDLTALGYTSAILGYDEEDTPLEEGEEIRYTLNLSLVTDPDTGETYEFPIHWEQLEEKVETIATRAELFRTRNKGEDQALFAEIDIDRWVRSVLSQNGKGGTVTL